MTVSKKHLVDMYIVWYIWSTTYPKILNSESWKDSDSAILWI